MRNYFNEIVSLVILYQHILLVSSHPDVYFNSSLSSNLELVNKGDLSSGFSLAPFIMSTDHSLVTGLDSTIEPNTIMVPVTECPTSSIKFANVSNIPPQSYPLKAGYDINGNDLGFCRVALNGRPFLGKWRMMDNTCFYGDKNQETQYSRNSGFEVLVRQRGTDVLWIKNNFINVVQTPISAGKSSRGTLYFGRCRWFVANGTVALIPGYVNSINPQSLIIYNPNGTLNWCPSYEIPVCMDPTSAMTMSSQENAMEFIVPVPPAIPTDDNLEVLNGPVDQDTTTTTTQQPSTTSSSSSGPHSRNDLNNNPTSKPLPTTTTFPSFGLLLANALGTWFG